MSVKLTLGSHPDNARLAAAAKEAPTPTPVAKPDPSKQTLGLSVLSLDGDNRARLGLPKDLHGARITKVRPGSPAFFAGVGPDDVIVSLNGAAVAGAEEFAAAVKAVPSGALLKLSIQRGPSTIFAVMKKP
jgi:serine protease Do